MSGGEAVSGQAGNAGHFARPGLEHDAGLLALAFEHGEDRIGGGRFGNGKHNIQPLGAVMGKMRPGIGRTGIPSTAMRSPASAPRSIW